MKFIHNSHITMKTLHLFTLALLLASALALIPLQKQEIDSKYAIGTIKALFLSFGEDVMFRSDDDLFGFISQKDGSLEAVYQLQEGEEIVAHRSPMDVQISKDKKLNFFLSTQRTYIPTYITELLARHPQFQKIVDFLHMMTFSLVLTDRYLMKVPLVPKGKKLQEAKEEILMQLEDKDQSFFSVFMINFFKQKTGDTYAASILSNDKESKVCFRKMSDLKAPRKCLDKPRGDQIIDIVTTFDHLFIEYQDYVMVYDSYLTFVQKVEEKVSQYNFVTGLITIGDQHQAFDPHTKTTHQFRIIQEFPMNPEYIRALQVEDTTMKVVKVIVSKGDRKVEEQVSIGKAEDDNPRKAWSLYDKKEGTIRLFVELDDGRLTCYDINEKTKQYKQSWEITTIPAEKTPTGPKLQADDIQAPEEQDIEAKQP